MPNPIINTADMVGAYMGSNQVIALYMGSNHVWGDEIVVANSATTIELQTSFYGPDSNEYNTSAITITFFKMYNPDPMMGGDWEESEVLGTFGVEYYDVDVHGGAESYWYIASSSVTSAVTSAEIVVDNSDGFKLSVVSPLLDGQHCDPATEYAFKAVAELVGGGKIKATTQDENYLTNVCDNTELTIDFGAGALLRTLTITNIPNLLQTPHDDSWTIQITDNNKFGFSASRYYDDGEADWVEDINFDNYDNPNVSYAYNMSAGTLVVVGDWDEYDGEGQGEYTLTMEFTTYECTYDYETYVAGEAQLHFTGASETIVFDEGNPICSTYMIFNITDVPNDGNVHSIEIFDSNQNSIGSIDLDMTNQSVTTNDDPNGTYYTYTYDDGNFGNGQVIWEYYGPFYGIYDIYVDNIQLAIQPDYDGSRMVEYVEYNFSGQEDLTEYSCKGEYDCDMNNGQWNSQTGECEYPE